MLLYNRDALRKVHVPCFWYLGIMSLFNATLVVLDPTYDVRLRRLVRAVRMPCRIPKLQVAWLLPSDTQPSTFKKANSLVREPGLPLR